MKIHNEKSDKKKEILKSMLPGEDPHNTTWAASGAEGFEGHLSTSTCFELVR